EGLAVVLPRPLGVALALPGLATGEESADIFRVDPDGFIGVGDRPVIIAPGEPNQRAVVVRLDVGRREAHGPIIVRHRLGLLALEPVGVAPVEVEVGIVGMAAQRLGIVGDGAVVGLLALPHIAAVDVGVGVVGIEPDRLGVVGDGVLKVALPGIDDAAV